MKININQNLENKDVKMEGVKNVKMRILIGPDDGSDNIIMRHFTISPQGHTPKHSHDFEHVVKIEKGEGVFVNPGHRKRQDPSKTSG